MQSVSNPDILSCLSLSLLLAACGNPAGRPEIPPEGQRQAPFQHFWQQQRTPWVRHALRVALAFDGDPFAVHAAELAELADAPWGTFRP